MKPATSWPTSWSLCGHEELCINSGLWVGEPTELPAARLGAVSTGDRASSRVSPVMASAGGGTVRPGSHESQGTGMLAHMAGPA